MFLAGKIIAPKAVNNLAWGASTTWNPSDKVSVVSLSGGDLTASTSSVAGGVRGTTSVSTGVRCFEVTVSVLGQNSFFGIGNSAADITSVSGVIGVNGEVIRTSDGSVFTNSASLGATVGIVAGDVIGVVLDIPASKVRFFRNGALLGNFALGPTSSLFPMIYTGTYSTILANFGATAFTYSYS